MFFNFEELFEGNESEKQSIKKFTEFCKTEGYRSVKIVSLVYQYRINSFEGKVYVSKKKISSNEKTSLKYGLSDIVWEELESHFEPDYHFFWALESCMKNMEVSGKDLKTRFPDLDFFDQDLNPIREDDWIDVEEGSDS